ncbi:microcystin LR degradation protein MlrC-like protein [Aquicoccus sp. SCR17]|nr:microcystin LR degradation protein MlrC-like protein [Carideicomes alvinocaridis]
MKLLIACLATETNSFSPLPTGTHAFEDTYVSRHPTADAPNLFSGPLHVWKRRADELGWEVVESLAAAAQPAGLTIRATYEAYRDEILRDLEREQPDVFLISMHGAMIAEGYDDCEGDLATRARTILGPGRVIGMECDPHAHLSSEMMQALTLLIFYKEYPHTDGPDRAEELFTMAAAAAEGRSRPVMRDYDCRMNALYHTPREPMRGFVDEMQAREGRDGVLSLSLCHGFPYGDTPWTGTRMVAITEGDEAKAQAVAEEFGAKLWDLREMLLVDWPDIPEALDRVEAATEFPLVLADYADNAGGGAPSDSNFVLAEVLKRGMRDVAIGVYWDPVLVRLCEDAGVGAVMNVRIGGKIGPASGDALDLKVTVRGVQPDMRLMMGETSMPMGTGIWLEADGVHIVVSDVRTQCFHPSAFTDLGLDMSTMKAVVVKSSNHFYAGFAPIASEVIHVNTPGTLTPDMTKLELTKRARDFWPCLADPFKESAA